MRGRQVEAYSAGGRILGTAPAGAGPTHVQAGRGSVFYVADTEGGAVLIFRVSASSPRQAAAVATRRGAPYGIAVDRGGPLVADLEYQELCDHLRYVVPRVDEVMALLAGRVTGHLDLKETGYESEVVALASSILGPGNFVLTTLEDASVATIKRSFPGVRTALSLGRSLRGVPRRRWAAVRHSELFPLARIRACGADWVAVNYRLAQLGVARTCHRNGIGIMVWTVDDDVLIDRFLMDQRIDVLITNRPGYAARRRSELGRPPGGNRIAVPPPVR